MIVAIKKPGEPAQLFNIGRKRRDSLESLIGGTPTQCIRFRDDNRGVNLLGWCDDDGYEKLLPVNFARPTDGHEIVGPVVITSFGYTNEGPDWTGLSKVEQLEALDLLASLTVEGVAL